MRGCTWAAETANCNPQNVSSQGGKSLTTRDLMSHSQDYGVARLQLHESFNWRAALWASVVAAFVFATLYIGLGWALHGISPWVPLRMMGAIVLGPAALSPPDTFDAQIVVVAILLHIVLSIVYGTFLALVMPTEVLRWASCSVGSMGLRFTTSISTASTPSRHGSWTNATG